MDKELILWLIMTIEYFVVAAALISIVYLAVSMRRIEKRLKEMKDNETIGQ